jgi:hypothetical protein
MSKSAINLIFQLVIREEIGYKWIMNPEELFEVFEPIPAVYDCCRSRRTDKECKLECLQHHGLRFVLEQTVL